MGLINNYSDYPAARIHPRPIPMSNRIGVSSSNPHAYSGAIVSRQSKARRNVKSRCVPLPRQDSSSARTFRGGITGYTGDEVRERNVLFYFTFSEPVPWIRQQRTRCAFLKRFRHGSAVRVTLALQEHRLLDGGYAVPCARHRRQLGHIQPRLRRFDRPPTHTKTRTTSSPPHSRTSEATRDVFGIASLTFSKSSKTARLSRTPFSRMTARSSLRAACRKA